MKSLLESAIEALEAKGPESKITAAFMRGDARAAFNIWAGLFLVEGQTITEEPNDLKNIRERAERIGDELRILDRESLKIEHRLQTVHADGKDKALFISDLLSLRDSLTTFEADYAQFFTEPFVISMVKPACEEMRERINNQIRAAQETEPHPAKSTLCYNEKSSSATWYGESLTFSQAQNKVFSRLYEAYMSGNPDVHTNRLLEGTGADRVRDVFAKGKHPAFSTLVVKSPQRTRGFWRIAPEEKPEKRNDKSTKSPTKRPRKRPK